MADEGSIPAPSVGRIVHVRTADGQACRAALVVRTWGARWDSDVNLSVFTDWSNAPDREDFPMGQATGLAWITSARHESVAPDGGLLTHHWHWPERA